MEAKKKKPTKTVSSRKPAVLNKSTVSSSSPVSSKINPSNGLFMIVVVLIVISAIQVFQTQKLLNAVTNGNVNIGAPSEGSSIGLPSQVGGC